MFTKNDTRENTYKIIVDSCLDWYTITSAQANCEGLFKEIQMDEETKSKDAKTIKLTEQEYKELKRLLQWSEDLPQYDKDNKPVNMASILGNLTVI